MTSITITGSVTDPTGAKATYSVQSNIDNFVLSAVITPSSAPSGTTRNITVTPTGGTGPFVYQTPTGSGLTFTPVAGQPNQWTFVY